MVWDVGSPGTMVGVKISGENGTVEWKLIKEIIKISLGKIVGWRCVDIDNGEVRFCDVYIYGNCVEAGCIDGESTWCLSDVSADHGDDSEEARATFRVCDIAG